MPFAATWIDLEMVILSEVSGRERQILYDIVYMWNLNKKKIQVSFMVFIHFCGFFDLEIFLVVLELRSLYSHF